MSTSMVLFGMLFLCTGVLSQDYTIKPDHKIPWPRPTTGGDHCTMPQTLRGRWHHLFTYGIVGQVTVGSDNLSFNWKGTSQRVTMWCIERIKDVYLFHASVPQGKFILCLDASAVLNATRIIVQRLNKSTANVYPLMNVKGIWPVIIRRLCTLQCGKIRIIRKTPSK